MTRIASPELVHPDTGRYREWLASHREWGAGQHEDGFGLEAEDSVETVDEFHRWVARLIDDRDTTYRWIVRGPTVIGGIALRHKWNDHVMWAGHVGFGIRPSKRGHGYASWALARTVKLAAALGMERILLVCAADNTASARTIEGQGGELEAIADTPLGAARRYWIDTGATNSTPQRRAPRSYGDPSNAREAPGCS
ncbi:GNAT family N-acetyltransferase [Williamsia maris]|nr:GNAT family N-acetyltransferase [Williamsia maris]